jgi:hypothetical protein
LWADLAAEIPAKFAKPAVAVAYSLEQPYEHIATGTRVATAVVAVTVVRVVVVVLMIVLCVAGRIPMPEECITLR